MDSKTKKLLMICMKAESMDKMKQTTNMHQDQTRCIAFFDFIVHKSHNMLGNHIIIICHHSHPGHNIVVVFVDDIIVVVSITLVPKGALIRDNILLSLVHHFHFFYSLNPPSTVLLRGRGESFIEAVIR